MKVINTILSSLLLLTATSALRAHPAAFQSEFVDTLVAPYLQVQQGLADDNLAAAKNGAKAYLRAMEDAPAGEAAGASADLRAPAEQIASAADLPAAREAFGILSSEFQSLVQHVGTTGNRNLFVAHCPMAFGGEGAEWVQSSETVSNPYYGASMLRCGSIVEQIAEGTEEKSAKEHQGHEHMGDGGTDHSAMSGDMHRGQHSAAELDRMHAGVPGYQAKTAVDHAHNASAGEGTPSTSDCGMGCCSTAKN